MHKNQELISVVTKFAESEWDLIDAPAKTWLDAKSDADVKSAATALIAAVKQADSECGSCGCEMDSLYKKALGLLAA